MVHITVCILLMSKNRVSKLSPAEEKGRQQLESHERWAKAELEFQKAKNEEAYQHEMRLERDRLVIRGLAQNTGEAVERHLTNVRDMMHEMKGVQSNLQAIRAWKGGMSYSFSVDV